MRIRQLLNEAAQTALYRGVLENIDDSDLQVGDYVTVPVRTNRRPLDSSGIGSAAFDYGIELLHGLKDIRKRALFTSTSPETAATYGNFTIKLDLDDNTPVLFNIDVDDSASVTNIHQYAGFDVSLIDIHPAIGNNGDKIWDNFLKKCNAVWYTQDQDIPTKLKQAFKSVIDGIVPESDMDNTVAQMFNGFVDISKQMVQGYQMATYGGLPSIDKRYPGVEVMLYDITKYTGARVKAMDEARAN